MKKVLTLFLMIALAMTVMAQKPYLAVYVAGDDPVNKLIGGALEGKLSLNGKYTVVERTSEFLAAINKEHDYQRSGEVDEQQIAALGKQLSVQYVCVVSVSTVWGNEKYISARIIDVESAIVMASGSSNGSVNSSEQLIGSLNKLSESLLKAMDYSQTAEAKKVAVYVPKTGNRDVDIILGDQLVAGFARSGKYLAIERTSRFLNEIAKEQDYQRSGAVDDAELARLGQQSGVNYVCVAKTQNWNGDYYIFSRLIDVENGNIVNSWDEMGKKMNNSQNVISVAADIATKLSGRTIEEEEAYQKAEAIRKEQEEQRRRDEAALAEKRRREAEQRKKQALIDRPWRDILKTTFEYKNYVYSCSGMSYAGWSRSITYWHEIAEEWLNTEIKIAKMSKNERIICDGSDFEVIIYPTQCDIDLENCPNIDIDDVKVLTKHYGSKYCRLYNNNGALIYEGDYKHGVFKPVKLKEKNSCSGKVVNNGRTFNEINYESGDKYVGEMSNKVCHGYGMYIYKNGDVWFGITVLKDPEGFGESGEFL